MTPQLWLLPFLVLAASALLTRLLVRSPLSVVDIPNERSLHVRPTPRTGGIAIMMAAALGWSALALAGPVHRSMAPVAGTAVAVILVSFADDRRGVAAGYRLGVHVGAALLLVIGAGLGLTQLPLPTSVPLAPELGGLVAGLFVVWMTNLYNFMDGMDGFAGGMAVSGFGFLTFAFVRSGDVASGLACLVVLAAALGFLAYNFPPARIFMGDVGSAPLGFIAAAMMLRAEQSGAAPLFASVLAFSPFIVDATVTLLRRAIRREKIWQAHRSHYYQRLVLAGWSHRRTVLCEYGAMLASSGGAITCLMVPAGARWLVLAAFTVAYAVAAIFVRRLEARAQLASSRS